MGRWTGRFFAGLALAIGSLAMLFPLWWMLVISLESPQRAGAAAEGGGSIAVWPEENRQALAAFLRSPAGAKMDRLMVGEKSNQRLLAAMLDWISDIASVTGLTP